MEHGYFFFFFLSKREKPQSRLEAPLPPPPPLDPCALLHVKTVSVDLSIQRGRVIEMFQANKYTCAFSIRVFDDVEILFW